MGKLLIYPLRLGTLQNVEKSIFTYGCNQGVKIQACFIGWYIAGASKKILVDTGPSDPDCASLYHPHISLKKDYSQQLNQALRGLGLFPEDIELVIFTHLHWDHCYNAEILNKASFIVQADEIRYAVAPLPIHRVTYEVGIKGLQPPWMSVFDRIEIIQGDNEIVPGISVVHLPGHTPGSQGVVVETDKGPYLIAGDTVPLYENWQGDKGINIPNGIHVDLRTYFDTLEKIQKLEVKAILPGHDEEVFMNQCYPI